MKDIQLHDKELKEFYNYIYTTLDLIVSNEHFYNTKLMNDYSVTCDNKIMITTRDINYIAEACQRQSGIRFNPFIKQKESCSLLIINDSIHLHLKHLIYNMFTKIITAKNGITVYPKYKELDVTQLGTLENPTKATKYKLRNLFNILSATSFSKNLVSFSMDFINSTKKVKVAFNYPLYTMLCEMQNNTIFEIYLEDFEIKLFKQIYKKYIINTINDLFKSNIKIPKNSSNHPHLYVLLKIKLMIDETYLEKKNNQPKSSLEIDVSEFNDMLSTLNEYKNPVYIDDLYIKKEQQIDQKSYQNELRVRKESEPDWLLLKDNEMGKKKQQPAVTENNNIGQIIDNFGNFLGSYNIKQYTNTINRLNTDMLLQERKDNYQIWKNDQAWKEIFYLQNLVLDILKADGGALWYDTRIKKYCFRSKLNGDISEVNSKELGDLLTRALKEKIIHFDSNNNDNLLNYAMEVVLVSKLKGLNNQKLSINEKSNDIIKILLFENEIKTIDDDLFNVNKNNEFFKDYNDFFYTQNRFIPNQYLIKCHHQNQNTVINTTRQTFIEKFIYYLVKENQELSDYIMNWLAYYFKNLKKSKTALVLLGEKEVTKDIFWNIIIKEIFSKQYCTTISDKKCNTSSVSDIAKDKLFFHIGDISSAETKFDDETLALIIKDLLIKPSVTTVTNEEVTIHGQMIITAKNPAPYLKKVLSKCTVIEVNDIDAIIEKLNLEDEAELEDIILSDLDKFTDKLSQYNVIIDNALKRVDTEARLILKGSESSNIDKEDIDKQIDTFIEAIKTKNIDYFNKAKDIDDGKQYAHMKNAFEKDDGYFIGQYLFEFYNVLHEQKFHKKQKFMDRLKEKDDMFKQEIKTFKILKNDKTKEVLFQSYKTTKEIESKELYKINNYKMAKDIIIPSDATIISSQSTYSKYTFKSDEEMKKCIQRTKKFREDKAKKK